MSQNAPGALAPTSSFSSAVFYKPPRILLVNIMDNAKGTEEHFVRTLKAASPDAQITLARMSCAKSDAKYFKEQDHLLSDRYVDWHDELGQKPYDLVIVTGINRGSLSYNDLGEQYSEFWDESRALFRAIQSNIRSGNVKHTALVCWSAFAAMKELYGVDKGIHDQKFYGLFAHTLDNPSHPLTRGMGTQAILAPQSRYSYMNDNQLNAVIDDHNGEVVMNGPDGPAIWTLEDRKITCFINHLEYGIETLAREFKRDRATTSPDFPPPLNYNPDDIYSDQNRQTFGRLEKVCAAFYRNLIELAHGAPVNFAPQRDRVTEITATAPLSGRTLG